MTKRQDRDAIYVKRQFDTEIIVLCVRWYITYRLSYRDLVAMMAERGVIVSHTTIMRWVIRYVPEFEKRWNRFARSIGSSWRVDETYISIKGKWHYLYRAVACSASPHLPRNNRLQYTTYPPCTSGKVAQGLRLLPSVRTASPSSADFCASRYSEHMSSKFPKSIRCGARMSVSPARRIVAIAFRHSAASSSLHLSGVRVEWRKPGDIDRIAASSDG
jgi:hypothetical protein